MRVNVIVAVGAVGTEDNLKEFMELLVSHVEDYSATIARDLNVMVVPTSESPVETPEPTESSS